MTQSNTSKKNKSSDLTINRGVELILGEKQKQIKPSKINFQNKFSIFKRKFYFHFEFDFQKEE